MGRPSRAFGLRSPEVLEPRAVPAGLHLLSATGMIVFQYSYDKFYGDASEPTHEQGSGSETIDGSRPVDGLSNDDDYGNPDPYLIVRSRTDYFDDSVPAPSVESDGDAGVGVSLAADYGYQKFTSPPVRAASGSVVMSIDVTATWQIVATGDEPRDGRILADVSADDSPVKPSRSTGSASVTVSGLASGSGRYFVHVGDTITFTAHAELKFSMDDFATFATTIDQFDSVSTGAGIDLPTPSDPKVEFVNLPDESGPKTDFVEFGLWDHAYTYPTLKVSDGPGISVKNGALEKDNFIGSDSRRFYIRVTDQRANQDTHKAETVVVKWSVTDPRGNLEPDEKNPGLDLTITLTETGWNSGVFVSKALMMVSSGLDMTQPTATGALDADGNPVLDSKGHPVMATFGKRDYRLRNATSLDDLVVAEYVPSLGPSSSTLKVKATLFDHTPGKDPRRLLNITEVEFFDWVDANGDGEFEFGERIKPYPGALERFNHQTNLAMQLWMPAGLELRVHDQPYLLPLPKGKLNGPGGNSLGNPKQKSKGASYNGAMATLIKSLLNVTPDNTLTVAMLPIDASYPVLGFATTGYDFGVKTGGRYFIFLPVKTASMSSDHKAQIDKDATLAHELSHALTNHEDYNRFGSTSANVDPQYFTLNTRQAVDLLALFKFDGKVTDPYRDVRIGRRLLPEVLKWMLIHPKPGPHNQPPLKFLETSSNTTWKTGNYLLRPYR